jgi:hypothetical protein
VVCPVQKIGFWKDPSPNRRRRRRRRRGRRRRRRRPSAAMPDSPIHSFALFEIHP